LIDLENREKTLNQPVHIINIDVADNHEDATLGAFILYELAVNVRKKNPIFMTILKQQRN
jgi:hypothetical protein